MRGVYPWLYSDYKNNFWQFYIDNMNLVYKIMYIEGSWTKETIIDKDVTGFGLFVDNNQIIHLVYGNKKGELKYCTIKDNKWVGKTLYNIENPIYNIENIKVDIIDTNMNIFFALTSNDGSDHGILMHCIWNGIKINTFKIADIILENNLNEYFIIKKNNKNELYLFYLSDDGDEISLNYTMYDNNKWIIAKRLYGIQGEEIFFDIEILKNNIHILNRFKENNICFLDHVIMNDLGNLKYYNICNSSKKNIIDPIIFNNNNNICVSWIEDNELFYSIFFKNEWDKKVKFNRSDNEVLERYNLYVKNNDLDFISEEKVYLSSGIDFYLYDPKEFLINKDLLNKISLDSKDNNTNSIDIEINKLKEENSELENKIIHLNLLLKKDKKIIDDYEQQLLRALDQKRKAEENCNIFLELQKKIQNEYEEVNRELIKIKEDKSNYKDYLSSYNEESQLLKDRIEKLENEIILKDNDLEKEVKLRVLIENELINLKSENELIRNEINLLQVENKKLNSELEIERNQSVMDRLLRRK